MRFHLHIYVFLIRRLSLDIVIPASLWIEQALTMNVMNELVMLTRGELSISINWLILSWARAALNRMFDMNDMEKNGFMSPTYGLSIKFTARGNMIMLRERDTEWWGHLMPDVEFPSYSPTLS